MLTGLALTVVLPQLRLDDNKRLKTVIYKRFKQLSQFAGTVIDE